MHAGLRWPRLPFANGTLWRTLAGLVVLVLVAADCRGQAAAEMRQGQIKCPPRTGYPLVFSPDSKLLAAGTFPSSTISIFDVAAAKEKFRLKLPGDNSECRLAFTADGRRLVSACRVDYDIGRVHLGEAQTIQVWDMATGKEVRKFSKPMMHCLAIRPDGKFITLSGREKTIKVYDVDTEKLVWEAESRDMDGDWIFLVAFSADGKTVATLNTNGEVNVLDGEKGTLIRRLQEKNKIRGQRISNVLVFSADGKQLAAGGQPVTHLHVWDVATGKQRLTLKVKSGKDHHGSFHSAAFSPNGSLMVHASNDGFVLFDLFQGKELCRLPEEKDGVFSPDGALLAVPGQTAAREQVITFYNMPKSRK